MTTPRSAFMLALAGLIDIHLGDGLPISAVATGLRMQLCMVDLLDQDRRYLPELAHLFSPEGQAESEQRRQELLKEGGIHGLA